MVIRKYIGTTEELGEDAVIMNVKQVAAKGVLRFFRKPSVEVTAAVDEVQGDHSASGSEMQQGRQRQEGQDAFPDFSKLQEAIQETNAVLEAEARKEAEKDREKKAVPVAESGDAKPVEAKARRDVSLKSESILEEKPSLGDDKDLEERLSSLQDLLEKQMQSAKLEKEEKDQKDNSNQVYFDMIKKKLLDNEVEETYIDQILDDISGNLNKNANLDSILAGVYQKIVLKIGQPHLIDIKTKRTKYVFFVGPTGVGKTTTIAKIASTLKLTKNTKVALITSDTYRIAAVEQLRTYANILGIPLQVVYSPEDMSHAMEELREFDMVFVDTAGRSHNNPQQKEDIQKLLETVEEANREIYLVLSATTKYRDLVKISSTYSEMTKFSLIFTKLDETDTIGNLYNIHMLTGAPLSYTTCGQNVPDDIGKIDAQNIAKQLLGGNG